MKSTFYKIENDKFQVFMDGFVTAVQLKNNAINNGAFIESVCLSTSIMDSLLRLALVFEFLLNNQKGSFPTKYIHQTESGKRISEKGIYNQAKSKGIIDIDTFNKLNDLYKRRNQVVHRYIISHIKTNEVFLITVAYDSLISFISEKIKDLEQRMIENNSEVCHTVVGDKTEVIDYIRESMDKMAFRKHNNDIIAKKHSK